MLIFVILAIVFIAFGAHGVWMVVNTISHPVHIVAEIALIVLAAGLAKHLMDNYFAKARERDRESKGGPTP